MNGKSDAQSLFIKHMSYKLIINNENVNESYYQLEKQ